MKLLVIVLNYRTAGLTIDCLKSLKSEILKIGNAKASVVENGSGDGSAKILRESIAENGWEDWADLTPLDENLGFTGGNNFIIRKAMATAEPPDYILLLNADTIVPEDSVQTLVRFMDAHPRVGIAGSRLDYPDGRPQGTPFRFHGIVSELDRGLGIGLVSKLLSRWSTCPPKPPSASHVDWVAGASMLIRREVIAELGPLDDGFFAYFEDMDYCWNAARVGWETWYVPESRIIHLEGQSSGIDLNSQSRRPAYWYRARRRYFLKNRGASYAILADATFITACALGLLRRRLQGKSESNPRFLLSDSIRHSVFLTGFTP